MRRGGANKTQVGEVKLSPLRGNTRGGGEEDEGMRIQEDR